MLIDDPILEKYSSTNELDQSRINEIEAESKEDQTLINQDQDENKEDEDLSDTSERLTLLMMLMSRMNHQARWMSFGN